MNLLILDFDRTVFNLDRFLDDEAAGKLEEDYLFEDAVELLQSLTADTIAIVVSQATMPKIDERTGVDWQYRKHTFAPALANLQFYVTEDNKGYALAEGIKQGNDSISVDLRDTHGNFGRVILVDDNAEAFKPLLDAGSPLEMYHLARPGEKYAEISTPQGVTRIAGLDEVTV